MRYALIALACLAAASCSRSDQAQANKAGQDIKADAQAAVHSVTDDPNLKKLGHELKSDANKAGAEIRKGAADVKVKGREAGQEIREKTR